MVRAIRLLGGGGLLLGAGIIGGCFPAAYAQQQPAFHLSVTTEQAQLLVQVLGAVSCPTVAQMVTCQKAKELLEAIQQQARDQSGGK
jgi:hypothetical protein